MIAVTRDELVELARCHLFPHRTGEDVARLLERHPPPALAGDDRAPPRFDPYFALNWLLYQTPAGHGELERELVDHEAECLDRPARAGVFRVVQRHRIARRWLQEFSALHLWIPTPLHLPGAQEVELVRASHGLEAHWLRDAGQIYNAPWLTTDGADAPELELELNVRVIGPPRSREIVLADAPSDPRVRAWVEKAPPPAGRGRDAVRHFVARIGRELEFALSDATDPIGVLLSTGVGDIATMTRLLSLALAEVGIASRIGAAHRPRPGSRELVFPGGWGAEHPWLQWWDPLAREGGLVDLGWLRRWGFAATPYNTPDAALRERLAHLGERARAHMGDDLYPGESILYGCVPASRIVRLASGSNLPIEPPVETRIAVERPQRTRAITSDSRVAPPSTIAVVIPVKDQPNRLRLTLTALALQAGVDARALEVIVIDDGSREDVTPVVDALRDAVPYHLVVARTDSGGRRGIPRNLGVHETRGELCVFLDADACPCRDLLAAHRAAHAAHSVIAVGEFFVIPGTEDLADPESGEPFAGVTPSAGAVRITRRDLRERGDAWLEAHALRGAYPWYQRTWEQVERQAAGNGRLAWLATTGHNLSLRRRDFEALGGFDAALCHFEGADLGVRAQRAGMTITVAAGARSYHLFHRRDMARQGDDVEATRALLHERYPDAGFEIAFLFMAAQRRDPYVPPELDLADAARVADMLDDPARRERLRALYRRHPALRPTPGLVDYLLGEAVSHARAAEGAS